MILTSKSFSTNITGVGTFIRVGSFVDQQVVFKLNSLISVLSSQHLLNCIKLILTRFSELSITKLADELFFGS